MPKDINWCTLIERNNNYQRCTFSDKVGSSKEPWMWITKEITPGAYELSEIAQIIKDQIILYSSNIQMIMLQSKLKRMQ